MSLPKKTRPRSYIIFDMEWNELLPYQFDRQNKIGFPLSGEIMEIGAVRIDENGHIGDQFESLVRPSFIPQMHPQIERLTGISWTALQQAPPFPDVMTRFYEWCGEHAVLLSWGTSDRQVLAENIRLHRLPREWIRPWFDAQVIFGRYCLDEYQQYGLERAGKWLGIHMEGEAHRAIHDAMYTAQICVHLPLARAVREYSYHRVVGPFEFRPTIDYYLFSGYQSRKDIEQDEQIYDVYLRTVDSRLALTEVERYRRNSSIALGMDHYGDRYLVRWKIYQYRHRRQGGYAVAREVYRAVPELIQFYRDLSTQNRNKRIRHFANRNPVFRKA